jgi:hypothetical protein
MILVIHKIDQVKMMNVISMVKKNTGKKQGIKRSGMPIALRSILI